MVCTKVLVLISKEKCSSPTLFKKEGFIKKDYKLFQAQDAGSGAPT